MQKGVFVVEVTVKSTMVDQSFITDVTNGDLLKWFLRQQLKKCLLEQCVGSSGGYFFLWFQMVRHNKPPYLYMVGQK